MINTKNTILIPFNEEHFQTIFKEDFVELGKLLQIKTPVAWTEFDAASEAIFSLHEIYKSLEGDNRWGSYFIISNQSKELIGSCCFKGKPDSDNYVEIGYEINKAWQNKGLATEVSKALVQFAFIQNVKGIKANTLPEKNASTKVLENCGFYFNGEILDSADGIVWQWILTQ